ncbi:MAG: carboxypeptidase-like regulatory domain-containing protein [Terriglobales bacterium]
MKKSSHLVAFGLAMWFAGGLTVEAAASDNKSQSDYPVSALSFIVLKDDNGKPIRNASVVMHSVDKHGKQDRGGLELKTDAEGKASFDGVPYGKLRVQALAPGFQTYGEDYEVNQPTMVITIKLKRPQGEYSIYRDQQNDKKPTTPPDATGKPQP